jgi:hypothetical protein
MIGPFLAVPAALRAGPVLHYTFAVTIALASARATRAGGVN